jgi:hypothetical protein
MPTILRLGGFRFEIFPGDHSPAHTHAYYGGGRAVIYLETVKLREQVGLKPKDVAKAMGMVAQHQAQFLRAWREINGNR